MEQKINVVAKDGKVEILTGNHFHELEDQTTTTFKTEDMNSFVEYVRKKEMVTTFFGETVIETYPQNIYKNTQRIALFEIILHPKLQYLKRCVGLKMGIKELDDLLNRFKNDSKDANALLSQIRNLRISAVTNIVRQVDNKGNYMFTIERKVGDASKNQDVMFPEFVNFGCPLLKGSDYTIQLDFELSFDYHIENNKSSVEMMFSLTNFDLEEQIKTNIQECLGEILTKNAIEYSIGGLSIHTASNEWKYSKNGINE